MQVTADTMPLYTKQVANERPENKHLVDSSLESEAKPNNKPKLVQENKTLWDKLKNLAKVVDSRESVYRLALEIAAFHGPALLAAATRNIYDFLEKGFAATISTSMVWLAPKLTSIVAKIAGNFIFNKEEQKDVSNYLMFHMNDLDSLEQTQKGLERIATEEVNDQKFIGDLYQATEHKERHQKNIEEIKNFTENFQADEKKIKDIRKLKEWTIVGESLVEGSVWGSIQLMTLWFRKHVLGLKGFSGNRNYTSEEERKKLGDDKALSPLQKIGTACAMFIAPVFNKLMLTLTRNPEKVKNSRILSIFRKHLDFTHKVFPRLGLLLSYLALPVNLGRILNSPGRSELIENLMVLGVVAPSWCFGHRATNGLLAKFADKIFAKKHGIKDVLLEKDENHKTGNDRNWWDKLLDLFPEPAKIQEVYDKTKNLNKEQKNEALNKHSFVFYSGFMLHTALVFMARMFIQSLTKTRALKALKGV